MVTRRRTRPAAWDAAPIKPLRVPPQPPVSRKVEPRLPKVVDGRIVPLDELLPEITPSASSAASESSSTRTEPLLPDLEPFAPEPPPESPRPADLSTMPATADRDRDRDTDRDRDRVRSGSWPISRQLHALLDEGQSSPELVAWIAAIRRDLAVLEGSPIDGSRTQQVAIWRLSRLAKLPTLSPSSPYEPRQLAARIGYALRRRTDTWLPVAKLLAVKSTADWQRESIAHLNAVITPLEASLATGEHADAWRTFLAIDKLTARIEQQDHVGVAERAMAVLYRMHDVELQPEQQAFLATPAMEAFELGVRAVIAAAAPPADLVAALEAYEAEPFRDSGNDVIQILQRWQSSPHAAEYQPIVRAVTAHYRNANLRVAVQADLINRMVPAISSYAEQVNDTILGAQVSGQNSTSTALSVSLIPDPKKIRLQLNALGRVQSDTTSRKGPVTMFNQGQSTFSAGKQLVIEPNGIFLTKTTTTVTTGNRLLGLRSDLDEIPFLGWLVRNVAMQQHDDQRPLVRTEIMNRIRRSASQKIDREVQQRLAAAERRVDQNVVDPLRRMNLDPKALEMRTTAGRVMLRARIAVPLQFGAHTPRPQARSDSLMSIQVHQSAANNLIQQLNLHGRRMTLAELMDSISEQSGLDLRVNDESNDEAIIQFADDHPLEFEFDQGRVTLTIHFAELNTGRRRWKNFSVRGYYRADVDQLDVELVRDEGIELISDRLRLRDQLALRGIFTKVFARNQRLDILRQAIEQQPQLKDLVVTQFTIRDGWLAIALGERDGGPRLARNSSRPAAAPAGR